MPGIIQESIISIDPDKINFDDSDSVKKLIIALLNLSIVQSSCGGASHVPMLVAPSNSQSNMISSQFQMCL